MSAAKPSATATAAPAGAPVGASQYDNIPRSSLIQMLQDNDDALPRKQRVSPDRPGAVQGAERRKRTLDGEDRSGSSSAGGKGIAPSGLLVRPAKPALGNFRAGRIVVACTERGGVARRKEE